MFSRFIKLQMSVWICIFLGILIFMIMRTIMLYHFSDGTVWLRSGEFGRLYQISLLFDLQTMSHLMLISLAISLLLLPSKKLFSIYHNQIYPLLGTLLLTTALVFAVINFYYYQYFNSAIDLMFFEVAAGQAGATLTNVWQEYPVVKVCLLLLLSIVVIFSLLRYLQRHINNFNWHPHWLFKTLCVFVFVMLYQLVTHEKVEGEPLRSGRAIFSEYHLFNQLPMNGLRSFYQAFSDRKAFSKPKKVSMKDGLDAYNIFFNQQLKLPQFSLNSLYAMTSEKKFTSTHPKPNVVFTQMEGMGRYPLIFHDHQKNNLLGALEPYFKKDFVFQNFVSGGNRTEHTLETLLINSPEGFVFNFFKCQKPLPSSVAKPFKEAGYKTIFLTSGEPAFANVNRFLPNQDFDEVIGKQSLLKKYPGAGTTEWGIYDEYMFHYAYELLQNAEREHHPIFIYMNSATNHPGYTVPANYHPYPIQVPKGLAKQIHASDDKAYRMFSTYQYTNDKLGEFIKQVENSPFGKYTIIGASGDHNMHELKGHCPNYAEYGLRYEVPFYLHVPKAYQANLVYDPDRIGSHKDIFPTIYSLALSNAHYLNLGYNLLSTRRPDLEFGYNPLTILLPEGIITLHDQQPRFYPWLNNEKIYVRKEQKLSDSQDKVLQRVLAYRYLMGWQLNWEAIAQQCM